MKAVSIFEAKAKLSGIVNYVVDKHEEVTITRHGHEVAKIVPIRQIANSNDYKRAIDEIEALGQEIGVSGVTLNDIKTMRSHGRR